VRRVGCAQLSRVGCIWHSHTQQAAWEVELLSDLCRVCTRRVQECEEIHYVAGRTVIRQLLVMPVPLWS
jgi:hypothetical protein